MTMTSPRRGIRTVEKMPTPAGYREKRNAINKRESLSRAARDVTNAKIAPRAHFPSPLAPSAPLINIDPICASNMPLNSQTVLRARRVRLSFGSAEPSSLIAMKGGGGEEKGKISNDGEIKLCTKRRTETEKEGKRETDC